MDVLRAMERQSGLLRLIVHLAGDGERPLTTILEETDISVHQLYSSIEKAREMGLVASRIDHGTYPNRNMISCTPAGKRVAGKLEEIVKIVSSQQS